MNNIADTSKTSLGIDLNTKPFQFIEYFPAAAFLLDENLVIRNVNKLSESITGYKKDGIIGKNIIEFILGNEVDQFRNILQKSFSNSESNTAEITIRTPDKSNLDVLSMFRCFKASDNDNKFCILTIIDFTPQKMKEEIIRDSEERFRSMANTAPVMIWIADVEGLFSFVNKVWLDYSGRDLGSQLGMNWLNNVHLHDFDKLVNEYQNALRVKKPFSVEFRFMDKKGKYEWMLLKGTPRYSQKNDYIGFIGSCTSIQDQKEIEAKISNLNEELVQTIATKDKFFSIISHDLRSPMGGLNGILDILVTDYETLDEEEKKEILLQASITSKTTYSLIENLLEWSRIQTGSINYLPERLNIHHLVNHLDLLFEQNLKNKEIEFINTINSNLVAYADRSITETIFRNLISNAIKFTYQGGRILVSSDVENDMVIIKIKDSGVGIEQENIPNLFRVDVSFSTKGTNDETGTGLGLIICKELAEKQKGKIWVESKKNEGSAFYFSMPAIN